MAQLAIHSQDCQIASTGCFTITCPRCLELMEHSDTEGRIMEKIKAADKRWREIKLSCY